MAFVTGTIAYVLPFLIGVTLLVFVHELGHYLVARWAGVRVEIFSIGFGPELFGWNDRHGTRWRVSAVPLGGYVMMFGDPDAMSSLPAESASHLSEAEKAVTLHHQSLPKRAAIIAAGPAANFLFAIVVLAGLFTIFGEMVVPAVVDEVVPDSAASELGLRSGDEFVAVDGRPVRSFEDLQYAVALNTGEAMHFVIRRDGQELSLAATPRLIDDPDSGDNTGQRRLLGVKPRPGQLVQRDFLTATSLAVRSTGSAVGNTLKGLGQILTGSRSSRELGGLGTIGIALHNAAEGGIVSFLFMLPGLSINLGLVNLFPIPVLDGGHLLFYAAEAVLGRPLGRRTQEFGLKVGLALVLTLVVFANGNDLVHRFFPLLKHLFT